jgi:hypothetical protein
MVVVSTFSGFSGALMATLTGKDSKAQSEQVPRDKANVTIPGLSSPNTSSGTAVAGIPESAAADTSGTPKIDGPVS